VSALARLAIAGLVRAPGQTAVRVLTLAAAVALLGAMLLFVGHSLRTMTASAVRSVPLDWQAPVASYAASVRAADEREDLLLDLEDRFAPGVLLDRVRLGGAVIPEDPVSTRPLASVHESLLRTGRFLT
jgi:hypothetical protein